MSPRARRQMGGFTLLEMMVTAALFGIVMAGVMGAFMTNQKQYVTHAHVSGMQSALRVAATEIERSLTRAGYGIDPNFALEPWDNGVMRDGTGPNASDSLVVQYRDPLFSRRVVSAGAGVITIDRPLLPGQTLPAGQRLLVLCAGPTNQRFAYVTVGGTVDSTSGNTINLVAGTAPFNQAPRLDVEPCLSDGSAWLTRVERRHYFIHWMNDINGQLRPMLMVQRGVDVNGNNTPGEPPTAIDPGDAELIALDVEQLQVAYVMNRPNPTLAALYQINAQTGGPDSDGNFIYGDQVGVAEVPEVIAPDWKGGTAAPVPLEPCLLNEQPANTDESRCTYGGKRRYTGHPGNVRSVRFTLSVRSTFADADVAETTPLDPELGGQFENLAPGQEGVATRHRRQRLSGSVTLKNIFQTRHFPPPVDTAVPGMNVDGA